MNKLLRIHDVVMHKESGQMCKVGRFAHDGTTDFWADNGSGPYKQADFDRLVKWNLEQPKPGEPGGPELEEPDKDGFTCHCPTFSSCTHK